MIIGLTGSLGCGKSTSARCFAEAGFKIISSDAISHHLIDHDNAIRTALKARWGNNVLDEKDEISRKKIGSIVFKDEKELMWLEGLLHPRINEERIALLDTAKEQDWVLEIPLLFEKKLENTCDYVVCIYTSSNVRNERLSARGYNLSQIEEREKRQISLQEKMLYSHFVITNDGSKDFLKQQIFYLIYKLYGRS